MRLTVYYVAFMIVGDLSAYVLGLGVEREWGSEASLIAFLALYFLFSGSPGFSPSGSPSRERQPSRADLEKARPGV